MTPVGVVLAGGAGRRIGGEKATVLMACVPLVHRALTVLAAVTDTLAVVTKEETRLPELDPGVALWREPGTARHPALGIAHALERAGGRPVLCVAVDLPLLDTRTLALLLAADDGRRPCLVARAGGILEPLCAIWHPAAAAVLAGAGDASMHALITALDPGAVDVPDPTRLMNVNTPGDLARATHALRES